ncbi:MAG: putative sulfate exporter family transporter [Hyphomicrobiales bacterium]|nr:putative sulfate exporter family transporter [Hyphomicrobiales bacterium]MCA1998302.1 putative sulfate exporter family transporter [Hyphomicrobiales bacterium]
MAGGASIGAGGALRALAPGLLLAFAVALAAEGAAPLLKSATGGRLALPAMVVALVIGILLHGFAVRPGFEPGIAYAVKKLLRYAIALLGLRIALGDILALGAGTVVLVVGAMAATIAGTVLIARLLGRESGFGALAGAANAVCGASATLATATVVPEYRGKGADIAFTVVMANAISTVVMLAYPPLCRWLGFDDAATGLMLGITIQDMAQVVGAGYAVSEPVGNAAVVVKLFRVFLLLPAVLAIGWWFTRQGETTGTAKVPAPIFAIVFLGLCLVNSVLPATPLAAPYAAIKAILGQASHWGLLIAIAALGLGTSIGQILAIGWRHVAVFLGGALLILVVGTGGLILLR